MLEDKIIIRKAILTDLVPITHLMKKLVQYDREFDHTIDPNWSDSKEGVEFLKDRILHEDSLVLVALLDGKIIGYLIGGLLESSQWRVSKILSELEEIFVLEKYRGNLIGGRLVQQFFDWSRQQKADLAHVVVSAANSRTIKLYRKLGFKDYDLILEKPLKPA